MAALHLHGPGYCAVNYPASHYDAAGLAELRGVPADAVLEALRREAAAPALRPTRCTT